MTHHRLAVHLGRGGLLSLLLPCAMALAQAQSQPADVPPQRPDAPGAAGVPVGVYPQKMPAEIVVDCARSSTTAKCTAAAPAPAAAGSGPVAAGPADCRSQCRRGARMADACKPLCKEMAVKPAPR